jgi:ribosomal protein S18 acetylase RimI-like enzyme
MSAVTIGTMLIKDVRDEAFMSWQASRSRNERRGDRGDADEVVIRRELRPGDTERIVELHDELYRREYDRNDAFVDAVRTKLQAAVEAGWPRGGGVWLAERGGQVLGSVALTDEGGGEGRIRWVLLHPSLRGRGLGRRMVGEAVARARELGMRKLTLDTFSDLRAAARIYRSLGFRVVSERERDDWGPTINYQVYELEL